MALPTTGLTAHYDASTTSHLFKTFVSGGPHTGIPVDGDSVAVWTEEAGANLIFKQSGAAAVPVWRQTTPLLPNPCVDFDYNSGQRLLLTNNVGTAQPLSSLITNNACTLLIAFYAETIVASALTYTSHVLVGDTGGYWGAFLGLEAGVPSVAAYNYDGTQRYVKIPVTAGAAHVLMLRHQGGTLFASLDGGAESSVASGNTQVLTNNVALGGAAAALNLDGRIGEIAVYNTALTGTNLTDAVSYFTGRWLSGGAAAAAVRVTQLVTETLSYPTPAARATQLTVETLSHPTPDARTTQLVVELLTSTHTSVFTGTGGVTFSGPALTGSGTVTGGAVIGSGSVTISHPLIAGVGLGPSVPRATQLLVETVTHLPPSKGRVSQAPVELLGTPPATARVSQAPAELLAQRDAPHVGARLSQAPLEIAYQVTASLVHARVSQAALEIIYPYGCYPPPCHAGPFPIEEDEDAGACAPVWPID